VIQDSETYEKMAAPAEYAESLLAIKQALTETGRPLEEFSKSFEARHGIQR